MGVDSNENPYLERKEVRERGRGKGRKEREEEREGILGVVYLAPW